ncbi:hypothetical protein [Geopsychrobacter electrodiphilus]|uniref:hypothetical protein n=1 Tax=Geopsychrobacter electrodiphilus TaxID=225196 RepID=UPI000381F70F|nr:hypothetical protein [Geopsychrobacter electrodiphilus]
MSLNALLSSMSQSSAAKMDPAILKIMKESRQQLEDSGLHQQALGAGEKLTDFVLRDASKNEFSSREALKKGPLLLSWYRGIW